MPPQDVQEQKKGMTLNDQFKSLIAICQMVAKPAELILTVPGTAGERYFGLTTFFGITGAMMWIGQWHGALSIIGFYVCIGLVIGHAIAGRWVRVPGQYSHYTGLPWLTFIFGVPERTAKNFWHGFIVICLGTAFLQPLPGLGSWLLLTAVGMAGDLTFMKMRDKAFDIARTDAMALNQIQAWKRQEAASPAPRKRMGAGGVIMLVLMALLGGAAFLGYTGQPLPALPFSLATVMRMARVAPITEEEKVEQETREAARQAEQEWREMEAQDRATRRAWRLRNEQAGFY